MKGFPNQIADLGKLANGLQVLERLIASGKDPKDDGVFGQALVRAGVLRTGHRPIPIRDYLREQLAKRPDRQSFRASARGLRELFRLLGLIDDSDGLVLTSDGRLAATFADLPLGNEQVAFWRRVIRAFDHDGGDETASHPYQVLLRLVARKPGISRAMCALALEARDDSAEELERIVALTDLTEAEIRERIDVSKPNWDNAKKVLPRFAEQLGDVIKTGQTFRLADVPGSGSTDTEAVTTRDPATVQPRRPRASRRVTADTIGLAGINANETDEVPPPPPDLDPEAQRLIVQLRLERLRRHNLLVRRLAGRFESVGMSLYEDPFDVLAISARAGILGEVKTLDGTVKDERERVREALGQLLYYEAFVTPPGGGAITHKVACFEGRVTEDHQVWLNRAGIATIWPATDDDRFAGDALAARLLGDFLEELR
jgi:hypothetical protein